MNPLSKTSKHSYGPQKVIDWRWLVGFVALGLLVSAVAWINGRPVMAFLNRIGVDLGGPNTPEDLQQRYLASAGDQARWIQSVNFGVHLYLSRLDGQPPEPQAGGLWSQAVSAEPDNAVGVYLQAVHAAIGQDSASAQFAALLPLLHEASERPAARWHVATSRNLWEKAMRAADVEELQAVSRAMLIIGYQRGRALREGGLALCRLSQSLAAENALDPARQCAEHADRWARLSIQADPTPQIATAAAEVLAEADGLLALFAAQKGDLNAANAYRKSAERAGSFREIYRRSMDGYPVDMFLPGAPRTTRPTAFRMMLRSLISVSVMLTGGGAAAATLIFAALGWMWVRRQTTEPPELTVQSRFWFGCRAAAAVSFPSWLGVALLQMFPIEEIFLGSTYWIGATLALVGVATLWALWGTARWWAGRSVGESSSAIRVWHTAGLILTLLWMAMLLTQWNFFGRHEADFDAGFQLDRAVLKHRTWAGSFCLITVLAGAIWCVIAWREARRGDPARRSGLLRLRAATLKAVMLLSGLGFLIGAFGTVLAERSYYRYDARYRALVAADLRDEVAARIGPDWRARYFAPPANR
jgi:hypothetical protein